MEGSNLDGSAYKKVGKIEYTLLSTDRCEEESLNESADDFDCKGTDVCKM